MKHSVNRALSALIAILMLLSLLPVTALAEDNGTQVYTSPDGLEAGQYYFNMEDNGDLYKLFCDRRQNETAAAADLAAFREAEWKLDTQTLAISAAFKDAYDPSGVFSLDNETDRLFLLKLLCIAGEDALVWGDVAVPNRPEDLTEYAHRQFFIDLPRVYAVYYRQAYDAADPDDYESEEELEEACAQFALYILQQLQSKTYGVRPDDPLFRVRMTWEDAGGSHVLYFPYESIVNGAADDVSPFVKEWHNYSSTCDWTWTDMEHVTVTFPCFLGMDDGQEDTISFDIPGEDIEQIDYTAPTELKDGSATYRASFVFYDSEYSDAMTLTDEHTFIVPATGNPDRLVITKEPEDQTLSYPEGAVFTVEVAETDNVKVQSYQWYDTDAYGAPVELDGLSAKTNTLILPSTTVYDTSFDFFCVITDTNGNQVTSRTAHTEMEDRGHRPVFYVGDIALQPGETLDLSETALGTGIVTFEGNEVTLDNIKIDLDKDHLLYDTANSPSLGLFAACSGCEFDDDEFYIHLVGDCEVNSNYYDPEHYSAGICIEGHFRASDAPYQTAMIIDGDGALTLRGGCIGINTDYDLIINGRLKTESNGQYYMEGIYANGDVTVGEGANVDIQSFGPGLFVDCRLMPDNTTEYHDLYIMDGAKVKIDATAGHVYSKNTQLYGIVVNGNAFMGAADVDIKMHAITATMLPYGGIVGEMTGLTAFNILLDGTQLSMPFDTETADEPYVSRIYGIQGESLQRLYLRDGAKVDITINADVLRDVAEGIQSGWEWTDEDDLGIIMEEGSELNIAMNTAGMVVFGIDFTNPVSVTDAVLNVSIESSGAEIVFGMSCLDANIELNDENGSVNVSAKDGIAVFISDGADDSLGGSSGDGGHDPVTVEHKDPGDEAGLETPHGFTLADALLSGSTDYDPDYTPKHILLSGQAEIATPTDGIISRYGFPYYGNLIPGETIYDPASPDAPAQRVVISVKKKDDGSTPDPDPAHSEICPSRFFSDIDTTLWYHEAVDYVIMNRLMIGVGDNEFCPQGTITRAMIVTILHRLDGEPAVSGANPFDDVSAEQWYTDAVIWASENGIVEGYGDGKFGPMDDTTREQFATILYRYAQFKGYDVSVGEDTNVFSFNDAFDVSEWAMPAIQWACGAELMQGDDLGNLLPGNSATRAQAAALIMRFIEHVK